MLTHKRIENFEIPVIAVDKPNLEQAEVAREKLEQLQAFIEEVDVDICDIYAKIEQLKMKFEDGIYDPKNGKHGFLTHTIDEYAKSLKMKGEKVIKLLNDDLAKWIFNLETKIEEISDTTSMRDMHTICLDQSFQDLQASF